MLINNRLYINICGRYHKEKVQRSCQANSAILCRHQIASQLQLFLEWTEWTWIALWTTPPASQTGAESSQQKLDEASATWNMEVKLLNSQNKREFQFFTLQSISSEEINFSRRTEKGTYSTVWLISKW